MNSTSKAKFTANSLHWLLADLLLSITCDPSLSFHCHAAATSHPSPWQPEPLGPMRRGSGPGWLASGRSHVGRASSPTWHTASCHMVPSHTSCKPGPGIWACHGRLVWNGTDLEPDPHVEWAGCTVGMLTRLSRKNTSGLNYSNSSLVPISVAAILLAFFFFQASLWAIINTTLSFLFSNIKMSACASSAFVRVKLFSAS